MMFRTRILRSGLAGLCLFAYASAQDENLDLEAAAGDNIGRTEDQDGEVEAEADNQLGRLGPVEFPVTFASPGVATMALYTPEGRLVRILAQAMDVEAREYRLRWDGLDLFGHLVEAGTKLELKVIHNPNLKATYEMSVSAPKVAPWFGTFTRNGQTRAGGWMGDHSAPNALAAFGDVMLVGTALAEEGDNVAAVSLDGEKIWGGKLAGWAGTAMLASGPDAVYALQAKGGAIHRIQAEAKTDERGRRRPVFEKILNTQNARQIAVQGKTLWYTSANPVSRMDPFRAAFGNGSIDFARSRPLVTANTAPTEFMIGDQTAFGNTFTSPGNRQNGATMIWHDGAAFIVLVLKKEEKIGTVVLPHIPGAARAEVHVLKAGVKYEDAMSPLAGGDANDLMNLRLTDMGDEWQLFGQSDLPAELNYLTSKQGVAGTQALVIKATPANKSAKDWRPRLPLARLLAERVADTGARPVKTHVATRIAKDEGKGFGGVGGWKLRTEYPISRIYPLHVVHDYGKDVSFNGVGFYNAVNPEINVDVLRAGVSPESASEEDWIEVGRSRGGTDKRLGHLSASRHGYERYAALEGPAKTRAVRFRMEQGYQGGKWGVGKDDSFLAENRHVALLNVATEAAEAPKFKLHHVDLATGKEVASWVDDAYGFAAMDSAPDGQLYTIAEGRLNRTVLDPASGKARHEPISDLRFDPKDLASLDVSSDRIAVGDRARNRVVVLDRAGKTLHVVGTGKGREPGPWDPYTIGRPSAVALAANGDLWVAEELFAPKRVARFSKDGKFIEDFLGPPMYGGGGRLDPDLKHFYYRSMEFELDWAKGTSRLKNLNDRAYHPNTPVPEQHTFAFTNIGKPIHRKDTRYLVGGNVVVRKPDASAVWLPAVVFGAAHESAFLFGKDVWNRHWGKFDLSEKIFVWCDLNGDGQYQIEEVELADKASLPPMAGGTFGPDLSLWGKTFRWSPRSFTDKGVPVFALADVRPFDYEKLAPHYNRNYTLSGPRSAKPGYAGIRYVTSDGYLAQEGQPFVVRPDGTILGGPPPQAASDYVPTIVGKVVQTAWSWAGGAMTKSDIGEIAVINSFRGAWHLWAPKHGVMVGRIFTAEDGGFHGMEPVRGMDVTRRYFGWEGWHADFVKGNDGNYYAQGGKSFHAISRVHGLDDFTVRVTPHTVTGPQFAAAKSLRAVLAGRASANRGLSLDAHPAATRLQRHRLDGELEDWGNRRAFAFLDDKERSTRFAASYDDTGMLLAFDGKGDLSGEAKDWKNAYREGFAIEVQVREKAGARDAKPLPGDRRIVFVRHQGQWKGVLYQPVRAEGPGAESLALKSPNLDLFIDEVRLLRPEEYTFKIIEGTLGDLLDLEGGGISFGSELQLAGEKEASNQKGGTGKDWTAEIHLPWSLIGGGPGARRMDVGIREAGPKGRHFYWNNAFPGPNDDPVLQADFNPGAWGTIRFSPPPRR